VDSIPWTELLGWLSSAVLVCTIGTQVVRQWKTEQVAGISRWLFIGQTTASTGFVIYSALLGNVVFVVTNTALLLAALTGVVLYFRYRRSRRTSAPTTAS
jgi:uncharacterized protein with PQ loop repeat